MIVGVLGGLGIFLLGMVLLTDGLKSLAGDALRRVLIRVVSGPWSGLASGAVATALVQSSTATTVTTIGFVSAGLLTFPQSVGVIFGSNLGTTSTGWIVSLLGFKVALGSIAPPIVLAGVALRLLTRGRLRSLGDALAGFGLLFLGIDMLQTGMTQLAVHLNPEDLPGDGIGGRLLMVLVGVAMTVVMQSSSGALAATLAALQSGAIGLEQSAALVIGQNIGTTLTAALAAIGAPAPARRTAAVHILFNLITGLIAFLILPLFLHLVAEFMAIEHASAATTLAAFHTAFNLLGVALLMPFVGPFSRFVERLIPERTPSATRFLSRAAAGTGAVALEAARRALLEVLRDTTRVGQTLLERGILDGRTRDDARQAIAEVRRFVFSVGRIQESPLEAARHAALMHAADHLDRLIDVFDESARRHERVEDTTLNRAIRATDSLLELASTTDVELAQSLDRVRALAAEVAAQRRTGRLELLEAAALGRLDPQRAVQAVDRLLRLDRICYHLWRTIEHLASRDDRGQGSDRGGGADFRPADAGPTPPATTSGGAPQ